LQGIRTNAAVFGSSGITYYPYVEDSVAAGRELLEALSRHACLIVTDDFPAFFIPRMIRTAAMRVSVLLEAVDSNGIIPVRATEQSFKSAHHFRRFVHGQLPECLSEHPNPNPLEVKRIPRLKEIRSDILRRWPMPDLDKLVAAGGLDRLPIDHRVGQVGSEGGAPSGADMLDRFLRESLADYAALRNHPEAEATSGLSPYLHFGHISTYEILDRLLCDRDWDPSSIEPAARGQRAGWWGLDDNAESFLDELITWRELGFNTCVRTDDYDSYESLPGWARDTLAAHRDDPRDYLYSLDQFESAQTHDLIWNAAQQQLTREGTIHGYLRMLWGKKILEWSNCPEEAFRTMIHLNNKYALDGRDPNSYSGISWVLGRYDRPWAPERPIFGRIRYMSSENTRRKFKLSKYLERYS